MTTQIFTKFIFLDGKNKDKTYETLMGEKNDKTGIFYSKKNINNICAIFINNG
jgi:hypothetical protein